MSGLVGKIVQDRYHFTEYIGRGGMAEVYKVWDSQRVIHLAAKVLHKDMALDKVFLRRFKRESDTLTKLQHPHIIRSYGMEQEGRLAFLLMDFVEGESLKELIFDADGPLPVEQIRNILRPVTGALHYAHSQGFVHCDIKPANIMLDKYGEVRVADFGIARVTDAATATMVGAGTPAYMAPEQVKGLDPTPQTDIYALGIVLFEMFTGGERPFTGETASMTGSTGEKIRREQLTVKPPSVRKFNPNISPVLDALIQKCLAKDPAERYQNPLEVMNDFERAVGGAVQTPTAKPAPKQPPVASSPVPVQTAPPHLPPVQSKPIVQQPASQSPSTQKKKFPVWGYVAGGAVFLSILLLVVFNLGTHSSHEVYVVLPTVTNSADATLSVDETAESLQDTEEQHTISSMPIFECTDTIGCIEIGPDEPVHIAYMLTISGATAFLGEDSKGGVEIAIDDRGASLLGHPIKLTGDDSGCNPEGGQAAATKVTSDSTILGVIGTNCSSAASAALETISSAGLVMISSSNTAPGLTLDSEYWEPGYYRVVHTDVLQGVLAADFAYRELGARSAVTIHDGSLYANQLQAVFAKRFEELGGTVTFQGAVNVGDTDMRRVLTYAAVSRPDVLYFPIFEPEGDFIVSQSSEISGLENTVLMGADGLLADSFPENAGPNVVGMYISGPYVYGSAYDAFLAKWSAKFGGFPPSGFHAFAYDATNILLDAVEAVSVVDKDGTLHIGRQAIRDYISNLKGYTGLTGALDCTDKDFGEIGISHGDCATGGALAIFELTSSELYGNWPPSMVYSPGK